VRIRQRCVACPGATTCRKKRALHDALVGSGYADATVGMAALAGFGPAPISVSLVAAGLLDLRVSRRLPRQNSAKQQVRRNRSPPTQIPLDR
jgi:hypothetical protein